MTNKVKIKDIIEEMEMHFEGYRSFVKIRTGEVFSVSEDDLIDAEDEKTMDDLQDWQIENLEIANEIVENYEDYKELPSKYEIDEYKMVKDFCLTVKDVKVQKILLIAIEGKGAFRKFKDTVIEFNIEMDWYSYRDRRYKDLAIAWCQNNDIEYID
ncbi:hypothetical protein AN960_10125 [Bacillus sp. FJAT-25509]|uniref:UPF0158 family protein n=1 Tax=Bacillus sp. FJAT-25509 TaxID=1712029 RepID=UPI0006FCAACE|nr:UPF0158 family protein [Bacillus sp. FJAT-25509]KQL39310.1 hypothetical protein AN960_10125 [Bacillus sp. FJAT-25509]